MTDTPDAFVQAQIKGIVGIEIEIASLDGKWKVSQNRPAADRVGVAQRLGAEETPSTPEMVELVR